MKRSPVLPILGALFCLAAALRVLGSADALFAAEGEQRAEVCEAESQEVIQALELRAAGLDAREQELASKALDLERRANEIAQLSQALSTKKAELESTVAMVNSASENDLAQLAAVYENMKPADAAELFSLMDPVFAAGFIARMRPEVSAEILGNIEPDIAYGLSVVLAGRNAKAGSR